MCKGKIKRFLWIIVFPLLFSFYIFQPFQDIELEKFRDTETGETVFSKGDFIKPGFQNLIAEIFRVPLKLTNYNVCFEDKGTYMDDGKNKNLAKVKLKIDNKTLNMVPQEPHCFIQNIEDSFKFKWEVSGDITLSSNSNESVIRLMPNLKGHATPHPKDSIINVLIFFISWLSLNWLASRTIKLINKGYFNA